MMSQLRVFLSHSSQDKAAADTIAKTLRDAGADVWYDEHNLGAGHLKGEIQRELGRRPIFIVLLSKAAFASAWVKRETDWADDLADRDPTRLILPVTVAPIERADFDPEQGWLFLQSFRRIEAPGYQPYPLPEAVTRLLQTLALTPEVEQQPTESVENLLAQGKALSAQNKYAEAVPLFGRATQLAPTNEDAWYNLGYVQEQLNHWQESLAACEQTLTLNPSNGKAWSSKARALRRMGRFREGLAAAKRAIRLLPDYAPAWVNKGSALLDLKRYDEALTALGRAIALDSNNAIAWYNQGLALYILQRYDEALTAFDRATILDPNYAVAWRNKGEALRNLNRYPEALSAYERSLVLEPTSVRGWKGKAAALQGLRRTAEAEAAERRAKKLGG
jgi:tetratricopeptide (TPR) repeat protein